MLTASDADSRGFVAKVADFGLARVCHGEQISPCKLLGTVSHIPPELFTRQILSAAGGIYLQHYPLRLNHVALTF
jgi:serine/threonine protein kinase